MNIELLTVDSARTAALEKKLSDARAEYERVLAKSPDREKVQWRIDVLGELISTLDGSMSSVPVPMPTVPVLRGRGGGGFEAT